MKKGGITFLDLLTLAFIILKIAGVINWPWFWVLSPIWIGLILFVVITVIYILIVRK